VHPFSLRPILHGHRVGRGCIERGADSVGCLLRVEISGETLAVADGSPQSVQRVK
jgi:hypothetical protein